MGALSDLDMLEKESRHPPIFKKLFSGQSVEQEAMTAFANKKKAQQMRYELQQFIGLTMGKSKWDELVAMEVSIRKRRKETLYRQRQRRRKFVEIVAWCLVAGAGFAVLTAFVLLLKAHTARADDWANDLTVCRLVKCMKVDKETEACIYRGAYNTQQTIFYSLRPREFKPREFLCQWYPDTPPPPNIFDVLEGIRDSRK